MKLPYAFWTSILGTFWRMFAVFLCYNYNNNNYYYYYYKKKKKKKKKKTKRCVTSCGMKRTSYCALHLRARAKHMNNTNAHTTITLMASPVCEALQLL